MILMPLPCTHILINLAIFYPFRKHLGKYWSIFAIFSGLILDFDFALDIIGQYLGIKSIYLMHGGFFHSLGFILILGIISTIIYLKNKEFGTYFYILTIGALAHLLLDLILGGGYYYLILLWPFSLMQFKIHLLQNYQIVYELLDAFLIIVFTIFLYFKIKNSN
jgi:hypothetical protein